jgi:hypothetical protein
MCEVFHLKVAQATGGIVSCQTYSSIRGWHVALLNWHPTQWGLGFKFEVLGLRATYFLELEDRSQIELWNNRQTTQGLVTSSNDEFCNVK